MNKEEFQTKKNDIDSKIRELNNQKIQLEKEYIESNQGFHVGSKVCITVPAHERFSLLSNERILVPEVKKLAYIADYEIDDDGEVVPSLRQLDYNEGMSAIPLFVNFKKVIIGLVQIKNKMSEAKIILDACCGSRMFWFDKENPLVLFTDIRDEEHTLCDGRSLKVHPDIVSDFTNMPFLNESFKLVVFDPPHLLNVGKESWLAKKYGKLPEDWPRVIKKGIDECFRVLENYGVLIFKWNEDQITVKEVLKAIGRQPLFGHTTGRHGKTMWMCFMKLPINE